uniref:RRM Nup35-type domain-containing protein n=1 Tax=Strongyloides venezuelensis TaxID=75913 RepID=A0A0K0G4B3_STRVS
MYARSSLSTEEANLSWASPSRIRDSMRGAPRFSTSGNQAPEPRGSILSRRSSFNTFSGGGSKNYNTGRPSLSGVFEDRFQQGPSSGSRPRSGGRLFGETFDVDMIEEDRELTYDDNRGRNGRENMPDYLFGPLSNRIPKRRSILTVDNDEDTSGQPPTKGILFERPAGFEKISSGDGIKGPPLKQLGDTINLPGYTRSPPKEIHEEETIDYRELSDEDFERSCWMLVFGLKNLSTDDVLEYLSGEFGSILKTSKKEGTNYIYVRFTNPMIVRKGVNRRCISMSSDEIIGLAKPLDYQFLSGNGFVMGDGAKENKNGASKIISNNRLGVRKVDLGKNDQGMINATNAVKKDGLITKLWNFVNT